MFFQRKSKSIEFTCAAADFDVIAPPVPAKVHLPEWFRKLPAVDQTHISATDNGLTIKRCMPFLDAMTTGWIIPWRRPGGLIFGMVGRQSMPVGSPTR